jgi:hypothetical protein
LHERDRTTGPLAGTPVEANLHGWVKIPPPTREAFMDWWREGVLAGLALDLEVWLLAWNAGAELPPVEGEG